MRQLKIVNPSAPSLLLPTWSRGLPAEARPGRRTAPAGLLARRGRPQRLPHSRGQRDSGGIPAIKSSGARRPGDPPVRAAGSDSRGLQPRRCSCAPGGTPRGQTPGT
ncbi:hypothetical protein NDU88_004513 [Pleurodeles waltl]|uniref:Uncharacterized protein n=1 Tax=Pleurodeles waltl TaxID=8319 RepID=A0AAV7LK35_PLEWA|nr:hypothetical protein NDU88_004513 [Pleurodeles waltl]